MLQLSAHTFYGKKWAIQKGDARRLEGGREAIHGKNRTVTADRKRGHR